MKPLTTLILSACAALALIGCGSSSDEPASPGKAAKEATPSAQDRAASAVCSARDDIQTQAETLSSLTAADATRANVTAALSAIQADLQKITAAQADLAPERRQQVQDATTAFGTQLREIVRQAVAGLSQPDAEKQATDAAAALKSAVSATLQPIEC